MRHADAAVSVALLDIGETVRLSLDGVREEVFSAWREDELFLSRRGVQRCFRERNPLTAGERGQARSATVRAPMPGMIARLGVACGDKVSKGDVLLVLEAMKMEQLIMAPAAGRIVALNGAVGEQVPIRHMLVEIDTEEAAP